MLLICHTCSSLWGWVSRTLCAPRGLTYPQLSLLSQLSQAGDLIIEVYLEQKLLDCCVTLKVREQACGLAVAIGTKLHRYAGV